MRSSRVFLLIIIVVSVLSYLYFSTLSSKYGKILTFEDCIKGGGKLLTVYPEKCVIGRKSFVDLNQKEAESSLTSTSSQVSLATDFKNLSYIIDGQPLILHNGKGEVVFSTKKGKATSSVLALPGELEHDVNDDNATDTLFILRGTNPLDRQNDFYYLTGAIASRSGLTGVNMVYLGENLGSSTLTYKEGYITFSASTKKERYFILENTFLKESKGPIH